MNDLFSNPPYPRGPGFKEGTTSRDAAHKIAPRAAELRRRVASFYIDHHPAGFTADEVATRLRSTPLSIRPRVSELHAAGMVEPTEDRRQNKSGQTARVWRATAKALQEAGRSAA